MKIIDLSMTIQPGMYMPKSHWHPQVEFTVMGTHAKEGRMTRKIQVGTHTGTHMDASLHFLPKGDTIDNVPLDKVVGPAQLVDVSFVEPRHAITPDDLKKGIRGSRGNKDTIVESRVVIRTGWVEKAYGKDSFGKDKPYFIKETVRWLLDQGVNFLLTDTPDPDSEEDFVFGKAAPIHVLLFENGITLVENIANADQLPEFFTIIALPLKLEGCDGAPARIIAMVE